MEDLRTARVTLSLRRKVLVGNRFKSIYATRGQGDICDGCSMPIEAEDMQYELEYCGESENVIIKLHRECWEAWRNN